MNTATAKKEMCAKYTFGNDPEIVAKAIWLDDEPVSGSEAVFDLKGRKGLTIALAASDALSRAVDVHRAVRLGYRPMHALPEYGWEEDSCDLDGWYDFYFTIYRDNQGRYWPDNVINYVVVNSDAPDNEEMRELRLSRIEQWLVMKRVLSEWKRECEYDIAELFKEE